LRDVVLKDQTATSTATKDILRSLAVLVRRRCGGLPRPSERIFFPPLVTRDWVSSYDDVENSVCPTYGERHSPTNQDGPKIWCCSIQRSSIWKPLTAITPSRSIWQPLRRVRYSDSRSSDPPYQSRLVSHFDTALLLSRLPRIDRFPLRFRDIL
jgi:hypothetical protein